MSHRAGESPSLDIAQAVSREAVADQVSSFLTKDARFSTNTGIPSSRTGVCGMDLLYTLPCESRQ